MSDLPRAALMVLNPSGQRHRAVIETLPFFLGRHADNQLVLRDNRVSRTHARIFAEHGHYVIEDLDSRHGTWVNGARISRHVLRNSDRIDFGVRESSNSPSLWNPARSIESWTSSGPPRTPPPRARNTSGSYAP